MEHPLWASLHWSRENRDLVGVLALLPAFEGLSTHELKIIERTLHQRRYKKGEIVFNEGEPGAGMYIIRSGEVAITRKIEDGGEMTLTVVNELSFFGELALLDEIPRSASARATADTVLFGFSKPSLEDLYQRNPRLAIKILSNLSRLVCRRLIKSNEAMEKLQTMLVKEKGDMPSQEESGVHV